MCLIAFAWRPEARLPLIVIANRDEQFLRPAEPLGFWPSQPDLLAGRDLLAGGAWMGLSRRRRFAAVTNVREPGAPPGRRSRGHLVRDFLGSAQGAEDWVRAGEAVWADYGPFNALLWDGAAGLIYLSNRPWSTWCWVSPGVHALSNAALDTPWPKTVAAAETLQGWLSERQPSLERPVGEIDPEPLFAAFRDERPAADACLPRTGVALELERGLSPAFIRLPGYGTRCTSFVAVGTDSARFIERSFDGGVGRPERDIALGFAAAP
jgi:uncharacterized protein with NRDE domain